MRKAVFATVTLSAMLLAAGATRGDDRKESAPRGRGALPANWSKLGLSDEQKQQIHSIQAEYSAKIDDLRQQMRKLEKEERAEMAKVLTDAQRARLREIMNEKVPGAGGEAAPARDKGNPEKK
jgi:Spy/CpxP family protein refolding chaperone